MSAELKKDILISIVIPVKNGDKWIEKCIQGIIDQTLFPKSEIIVLDSGSTDSTLAILANYPVQVIHIPPNEFNHGLTRNHGVQVAKGKFVVMTVQDANPVDNRWLEKLLECFEDEAVAGVCGQQIVPHDIDKNPVDWYLPVSEPAIKIFNFSKEEFDLFSPDQKAAICSWDNVNAMYRRISLLQIPFRNSLFGEDAIWALDAIQMGKTIVYQPSARVFHYHNENRDFVFKRHFTTNYFRYIYFGVIPAKPKLTLRRRISIIKIIFFRTKNISLRNRCLWWKYNIERFKGKSDAYKIFIESIKISKEELDAVHEKYCGIPPLAPKSK
ncbi:glycosyltransferase family 2 protein [Flavihumibacter fluvii]|uniref:glycosyltransferase family 2 protein n=1 Tax=Flavihumibacter fluvii TaxID=2838157 RepID=UPI001BDEEEAB|nr:glycosyltransferase family 2 protein [Flavihumibacter fluvii]ULQ52396.1 glycosyltransferase [Flavihumibacter fluvii]